MWWAALRLDVSAGLRARSAAYFLRLLLWAAAACTAAEPSSAQEPARPTLPVGALSGTLRIDGLLDEPEWAAAPSALELTMVEPSQGAAPTGRTIVKVLASSKALVFGIRCEDPEPAKIVRFTKERDGALDSEDHVLLLLDPFQDGRSGYIFAVNHGGARLDALVNPGGESVDTNWDGEWEAGTARDGGGWTAEIRIPIHTLSFARPPRMGVQRGAPRPAASGDGSLGEPTAGLQGLSGQSRGPLAELPSFDSAWDWPRCRPRSAGSRTCLSRPHRRHAGSEPRRHEEAR